MITNQEFDEDIPDEVEETEPAPEPVERPAGQFKRVLHGRPIWFKAPIPGQFNAFKRYRESLARRYELIQVRAKKTRDLEMLEELQELADKIEMSTLEFFEALLADENDADFIAIEMIGGRVTMEDIHDLMFRSEDPDDDQEPVRKEKPVRKQPASKKAANAKRTQRK